MMLGSSVDFRVSVDVSCLPSRSYMNRESMSDIGRRLAFNMSRVMSVIAEARYAAQI
jgi:hypothetical protein